MPADEASQGEQAAATSQTASTPTQEAPDKQTTTHPPTHKATEGYPPTHKATEGSSDQSDDQELMTAMGIPAELQAQMAGPRKSADAPRGEEEAREEEEAVDTTASTTPEAESEEEDSEEKDEESELKPAAEEEKVDKRQKRINRLTRQKRELETKLDSAVSEAEKLREELEVKEGATAETPAVPSAIGRLAHITSEAQLAQEVAKAEGIIDWCDAHTDGARTREGEKEIFIEPMEVAEYRRNAEKTLLSAPNRRDEIRAFNTEKTHFDNLTKQQWPEVFDKNSQEEQVFIHQVLKDIPGLKSSPRMNYYLGLAIEAERSVAARTANAERGMRNGEKKPHRDISERAFEPRVPIAPHTPEPPSREATPSSTKKLAAANTKLVTEGGRENLIAALEAEDELEKRSVRSPRQPVAS